MTSSARTVRRHRWLVHLLGILLMSATAAAVAIVGIRFVDFYQTLDDFGKGLVSGGLVGFAVSLFLRCKRGGEHGS